MSASRFEGEFGEAVDGGFDNAVMLAEAFLAGGESMPLYASTTVNLARAVIAQQKRITELEAHLGTGGAA